MGTEQRVRLLTENEQRSQNMTRNLKTRSQEAMARLIAGGTKYTLQEASERLGVSRELVKKLMNNKDVRDRAWFLLNSRVRSIASRALTTLEDLLDSDDDRVRLGAARDLLDRAGLVPDQSPQEAATPFTVVLNLGGGLKTGSITPPPPIDAQFLDSRDPIQGRALQIRDELEPLGLEEVDFPPAPQIVEDD